MEKDKKGMAYAASFVREWRPTLKKMRERGYNLKPKRTIRYFTMIEGHTIRIDNRPFEGREIVSFDTKPKA